MRRRLAAIAAAFVLIAATLIATAPVASAGIVGSGWQYCGAVPNEYQVYIQVNRYSNNFRDVAVWGNGIGYNGYKFPVKGPSIWDSYGTWDSLIYQRSQEMNVGWWYGLEGYGPPSGIAGHTNKFTGRIFSEQGNWWCDAVVLN